MSCPEQFILFGDSLTERAGVENEGFRFKTHLENALNGKYEVVVHGFPGANTYQALDYVKTVIQPPEKAVVRFLAIWFGTNDADKSRQVPIEDYKRNLTSIINSPEVCAHMPNLNIILITPPPVEETLLMEHKLNKYGWEGPPTMTADLAAQYAKEVIWLAQELKLNAEKEANKKAQGQSNEKKELPKAPEVLDIWSEFISLTGWREGTLPGSSSLGKNKDLAKLLNDGVHLTAAGYMVVHSLLLNLLVTKWLLT